MAKGEGPYHNNPHKDGPARGHEKPKVQPDATNVGQGRHNGKFEDMSNNDGMTGPVSD
jgi:hypothetical protein